MPTHALPSVVAFAIVLVACNRNEFKPPPPPTVTVAPPLQDDVTEYAEFTGTTEPFETVEVRARVEGVLLEITYQEGQPVEVGKKMFAIDPAPFQAARDAAHAEVKSAEAKARLADTTAARLESAYANRAVSEIQALEARAKHEVAMAEVEVANKKLAIRELDLSYTTVTAPLAGRAKKSDYFVGSLVGGFGTSALTTIVDDSKIRVSFTVPDRALLQVRKNRREPQEREPFPEVDMAREIDRDFPFHGKVDYSDPAVDPATGTLRMRAVFDNAEGRLFGGLFARVRFAVGTLSGALLVPESALAADQAGRHLLVVGDGDVVERRDIVLGPETPKGRVILEGIEAGDRIIIAGLMRARPGAVVTPHTADEKKR